MNSKTYHLREFINPADGRSIVVDTSAGLSLGPLPGLEHFMESVSPILPVADGLIASPGQSRKILGRTRQDAALLMRADWTNALRSSNFVLPPETIIHIPMFSPRDGLDLGVSALVVYFLLGHEEQIEAGCLKTTVQFAIQGGEVGIPLIVDVQPVGPRVVMRDKAIELGVSYALEAGADGIAVPWPGRNSFEMILAMSAEVPVWVKPSSLDAIPSELDEALALGGVGLWLDERLFTHPDPIGLLKTCTTRIHPALLAEQP